MTHSFGESFQITELLNWNEYSFTLVFLSKNSKEASQSHLKRANYSFPELRKSEECTEVTENKCGSKEIQKLTQKETKRSLKI